MKTKTGICILLVAFIAGAAVWLKIRGEKPQGK